MTVTHEPADLTQGDVSALIPCQVLPIYANLLMSKAYDCTYNAFFNVFQSASFARGETTGAVVAQFGQGESALSGNMSWGGNHVGIASVAGATAIAEELNCLRMHPDAAAYGLVISAAGTYQPASAVQIQSNHSASTFQTGILFNSAVVNAVSGALILADENTVAQSVIDARGTYSVGEVAVPSFAVGATPEGLNSRILITGSATGNPSISAAPAGEIPATNANLALNPMGSGEVQINGKALSLTGGGSLKLTPGPAPPAPASGWAIYADGNGNLKAKNSAGKEVTLGTSS